MTDKQQFKPYSLDKIQVCSVCGKLDVSERHEKVCDPEWEEQKEINIEYYD